MEKTKSSRSKPSNQKLAVNAKAITEQLSTEVHGTVPSSVLLQKAAEIPQSISNPSLQKSIVHRQNPFNRIKEENDLEDCNLQYHAVCNSKGKIIGLRAIYNYVWIIMAC